jgi:hypothetical protein
MLEVDGISAELQDDHADARQAQYQADPEQVFH